MNTDAEALAAYFEDWRDGDPVPGGWEYSVYYSSQNFNGNAAAMPAWFRREDASTVVMHDCPEDLDIQALTGLLVVELAKKGKLEIFPPNEHYPWVVATEYWLFKSQPTLLCALVSAWKAVRDG